MSFERPSLPEGLSNTPDIQDVAKALGYGTVSTDSSLLTQGGAASYQSLEDTITEITFTDKDLKVLASLSSSQAGQIIDEWDEVYATGYRSGMTKSDDQGGSKSGTRSGIRRFTRLKFQSSQWNINQSLLKSKNFMQAMNKEDVTALNRMRRDLATDIYEGDASIGDDGSTPGVGGIEFDGIYKMITDVNVSGRYDGPLVYDAFINGTGLDGDGFSNPADIEAGVKFLGQRMSQPDNGGENSGKLWVGTSVIGDIQEYKNFDPYQILSAGVQSLTTGAIINGFANRFTEGQITTWNLDKFLPDARNQALIAPQFKKGGAVFSIAPTLAVAPGTDATSRFDTGWDGNYFYAVAPFGKDISPDGYEGSAVASAVAAVAVGGKVTLTITRGAGAKEAGYMVYRSKRNGTNDVSDMRLIKRISAGATTTVFTDVNRELPGAVKAYLVDWSDPQSIEMRYVYTPFRVELPRDKNAALLIPGVVLASYGLRSRRHRALACISNYVAKSGGWNPR